MDDDPCFLAQFPRDRLLDRFAHLDKARERRIATGREPRLAAKQDMIVMDRKHDDDRVGSRKMIRLATVAAPCPTAPDDVRRNAAVRAEAVAPVPAQKAAGAGIERGLAFRQGCGDMEERKSVGEGNSVAVRVVLGGSRTLKKKK